MSPLCRVNDYFVADARYARRRQGIQVDIALSGLHVSGVNAVLQYSLAVPPTACCKHQSQSRNVTLHDRCSFNFPRLSLNHKLRDPIGPRGCLDSGRWRLPAVEVARCGVRGPSFRFSETSIQRSRRCASFRANCRVRG